jgi:hypothetical protein
LGTGLSEAMLPGEEACGLLCEAIRRFAKPSAHPMRLNSWAGRPGYDVVRGRTIREEQITHHPLSIINPLHSHSMVAGGLLEMS